MSTECSNKNHSAVFPVELPTWFIKLFTQAGDTVLDPFIGSGTTALAAIQQGRNYVGIDTNEEFVELSRNRISDIQISLPIIAESRETFSTDAPLEGKTPS
jgi:site-specific DNA-methyltransferase (adenine-specific)/site-specific DNA-methyltransferase (cytosine-N4-specific)